MDKKQLRQQIFRHLDGLVTAPIFHLLHGRGILQAFHKGHFLELGELAKQFQANEGYLNVALRVLASQGLLRYELQKEAVRLASTPKLKAFFEYENLYGDLRRFLETINGMNAHRLEVDFCMAWMKCFTKYQDCLLSDPAEDSVAYQVVKHIEGVLIGPLIVRLGRSGMFHKYFMQASFSAAEFHQDPVYVEQVLSALGRLGWFTSVGDHFQFTDKGLFFARRATAYGVTVSYLPLFARLEDLVFGDPAALRTASGVEQHVDREMNVWGSGGAHSTYFKVIDTFITEIFNQPIEKQPKGILDMGCGNGALLQHLYELIERHTLRGKMLEEYPLFLVGADYNEAALKVTRANLIRNDIWAKVLWGDIGDPAGLARDLKRKYAIDLADLLNIRTFLDHNRVWEPVQTPYDRVSTSTGAYAFRGERLSNAAVEENLLQHLRKWTPYVQQFGLLTIELHTLSPALTAQHLGQTAATAYDATHGFSDQYIVEVEVFHKICQEAGLQPDPMLFQKFPDNELATISVNLLKQGQH